MPPDGNDIDDVFDELPLQAESDNEKTSIEIINFKLSTFETLLYLKVFSTITAMFIAPIITQLFEPVFLEYAV